MVKCVDCGLLAGGGGGAASCVRLKEAVEQPEAERECPFFFALTYDGPEPYSPEEHLRLQESESRRRAMRGPV